MRFNASAVNLDITILLIEHVKDVQRIARHAQAKATVQSVTQEYYQSWRHAFFASRYKDAQSAARFHAQSASRAIS